MKTFTQVPAPEEGSEMCRFAGFVVRTYVECMSLELDVPMTSMHHFVSSTQLELS